MRIGNPFIDGSKTSVPYALSTIPRKGSTKVTVHGTIPIPPWANNAYNHIQSVAPYNGNDGAFGNGFIAASSSVGYIAGFTQVEGQQATVRSVVVPDQRYDHAAGIQLCGDLLAVGLESDDASLRGLVAFYDASNPASPGRLYSLQMPDRKASCVALTTYKGSDGREWALMFVYGYDPRDMYIWRAPVTNVMTPSGWTLARSYSGPAYQGDQFQNFALVTQDNGKSGFQVYLLGFREDEELHLWTISTHDSDFGEPRLYDVYTGWDQSDWRAGVGLQIASDNVMRIFGTDFDPSGSSNYPSGPANYTFNLYVE